MKKIKFFFKEMIKGIISEMIDETIQTSFDELRVAKLDSLTKSKKIDVFQIMENFPIKESSFQIVYIDENGISKDASFKFYSFQTLKRFLIDFEPEHESFSGVYFRVKFLHKFGEKNESKIFVNEYDNKVYRSSEITKITTPILEWIDLHPELLV